MKRIVIYIAVLAAALMVPLKGTDVGKLQPAGLVQIYKEEDAIVILTDTGDSGRGESVEAAFQNLKETTAGDIFLDTADVLLISKTAIGEAEELENHLKPTIRVCFAEADVDPGKAAEYLTVHRPKVHLKDHGELVNAGTLSQENGRLILK